MIKKNVELVNWNGKMSQLLIKLWVDLWVKRGQKPDFVPHRMALKIEKSPSHDVWNVWAKPNKRKKNLPPPTTISTEVSRPMLITLLMNRAAPILLRILNPGRSCKYVGSLPNSFAMKHHAQRRDR